jgi:anti-sigma factor RsiW
MKAFEEKYFMYSRLDPEGRRAVDEHLEAYPEERRRFDELQALGELSARLEKALSEPVTDDMLAYFITRRAVSPPRSDAMLRAVFRRIEQMIEDDPEVMERFRRMQDRFDRIAEASQVSRRHLDELRRRSPDAPDKPGGDTNAIRSGPVVSLRRLGGTLRMAAMAVFLMGAAYGILYLVGDATRPVAERIARLEQHAGDSMQFVRANTATGPSEERLYESAVGDITRARQTVLGLFPRYDHDRLLNARQTLGVVIERTEAGTFLNQQALYLKGKISLVLGDTEAARIAFQQVALGDSLAWSDALRLIDAIDRAEADQRR